MTRKETTLRLKRAATYYFVDKGHSVYDEVGLKSGQEWSRFRADILALTMKREVVIVEVKSGWQDFIKDIKWTEYLQFCNKMYFIIEESFHATEKGKFVESKVREQGVGLMVVSVSGKVRVVANAKRRDMVGETKKWIYTKLAWRGGFSKATVDRSMRFDCGVNPGEWNDLSLIQFLGLSKADRNTYISKRPKCGYKKYVNYPNLNTDSMF